MDMLIAVGIVQVSVLSNNTDRLLTHLEDMLFQLVVPLVVQAAMNVWVEALANA